MGFTPNKKNLRSVFETECHVFSTCFRPVEKALLLWKGPVGFKHSIQLINYFAFVGMAFIEEK